MKIIQKYTMFVIKEKVQKFVNITANIKTEQ